MKSRLHMDVLRPLDIENDQDLGALLNAMAGINFGAHDLGRAYQVLRDLIRDPDCGLILTLSGAVTVAKLGQTFGSLLNRSAIQAVVTTGAIVTHSLVEELGLPHYRVPAGQTDADLYARKLNRIYDTVEPEANLNTLESRCNKSFRKLPVDEPLGSCDIIRQISRDLFGNRKQKGLIGAAHAQNIPVFVPALADSEIGLNIHRFQRQAKQAGEPYFTHDPIRDLDAFADWMAGRKRIGFLTLGGGAPRNWAQQMRPYLVYLKSHREFRQRIPAVSGAVRICPDPVYLGHLSGCTYTEGVSWGKFSAKQQQRHVEVFGDANIVFPILAKALIDSLDRE